MFRSSFATDFSIFLLAATLLTGLTGCQVPFLKAETMSALTNKLPFVAKPAPTTLDMACVADCDAMRPHCEQRQRLRETECEQHFKPTSANHTACTADNRGHCLQPVVCLGADLGLCKTQYDECLHACQRSPAAPATPESVAPLMPAQATAAVGSR